MVYKLYFISKNRINCIHSYGTAQIIDHAIIKQRTYAEHIGCSYSERPKILLSSNANNGANTGLANFNSNNDVANANTNVGGEIYKFTNKFNLGKRRNYPCPLAKNDVGSSLLILLFLMDNDDWDRICIQG